MFHIQELSVFDSGRYFLFLFISVSNASTSTKTECDYLNGWIKKRSHTQKSHPKVVNPRDLAGEHEKKQTKQHKH